MSFQQRRGLYAIAAMLLGLAATPEARAQPPAGQVSLTDGLITGAAVDGLVIQFLGIRYAAPPVGELRWKPPQPPKPWSGVEPHVTAGPSCPQTAEAAAYVGTASINEDCLNLDVYMPLHSVSLSPPAKQRPVMVWFYGGSFAEGSIDHYDGSQLAVVGDVIVVTVNYRIGAFGGLALPGLSQEMPDGVSGNLSIRDQQAALSWVHDNIAAFGGDPGNVTIFGQSAGGQSVIDHMVSPLSAGLFAKAIIQSGTYAPLLPALEDKEKAGLDFADTVGCRQPDPAALVRCMRAASVEQILAAQPLDDDPEGQTIWNPTQGGAVLPSQPLQAIVQGPLNKGPVLIGSTRDEARLFVGEADLRTGPLKPGDYLDKIRELFADLQIPPEPVAARYPLSDFGSTNLAYAQVFTDAAYACSSAFTARLLSQANLPVYQFEVADEEEAHILGITDPFMDLGSAHTGDVVFLWPNNLNYAARQPARFTVGEAIMSLKMTAAWTAFARSGNPWPIDDAWPPFKPGQPGPVMVLTPDQDFETISADRFAASHRCDFWEPIFARLVGG